MKKPFKHPISFHVHAREQYLFSFSLQLRRSPRIFAKQLVDCVALMPLATQIFAKLQPRKTQLFLIHSLTLGA